MDKVLKGITNFINENSSEFGKDNSAILQLNKLIDIINSNDKSFELNGEDYGVYLDNDDVTYGGHSGAIYTLDLEEFSSDVDNCLDNWWLPTVEGPVVDIWLLK